MASRIVAKDLIKGYLLLCIVIYCLMILMSIYMAFQWFNASFYYFMKHVSTIVLIMEYVKAAIGLTLIIFLGHFLINAYEVIQEKRQTDTAYFILTFATCFINVVLMLLLYQDISAFLRLAVVDEKQFFNQIIPILIATELLVICLLFSSLLIYKKENKIKYKNIVIK